MTWRSWAVLAATLAGVAITLRLGAWQLDRAAQKEALQAAVDRQRALPALEADSLARDEAGAAAQHHRAIRLTGVWMPQHTVYLENRQMNGRPGFFVVTPLLFDDGRVAVVQRGWLPRDAQDRTRIAEYQTPGERVRLWGRIAPPPARLYEFEAQATGAIRQNLDLLEYTREVGRPLLPLSIVQEDRAYDAPAKADGLLREWPAPGAGVHKHYGYAVQWFALAGLMTVLYVWFQLVRPRIRRA